MISPWYPHDIPMISPWPHGPMAAAMAMIRRPGTRWSPPWRRAASAGAAWCDSAPRGGCRRPAPPDPTPAGWGPRSIAKLVYNSNITMVYGTQITSYNYSYWGESKPTYNWGASHCAAPRPKAKRKPYGKGERERQRHGAVGKGLEWWVMMGYVWMGNKME